VASSHIAATWVVSSRIASSHVASSCIACEHVACDRVACNRVASSRIACARICGMLFVVGGELVVTLCINYNFEMTTILTFPGIGASSLQRLNCRSKVEVTQNQSPHLGFLNIT
jgi:hypothetical protein